MEGGSEMNNFIKLWFTIIISLCYCYTIGKRIPQGTGRVLCLMPVICLFILLPLNLTSIHLGGFTSFFITWLCNFKLLLFGFGKGPLSPSMISLPHFLALACLPIKIQHSPKTDVNGHIHDSEVTCPTSTSKGYPKKGQKSPVNYATKTLLFALLLRIYDFRDHIHPTVILILYCLHIYFSLEIILAMVAVLARGLLGIELEEQFNEPYLATSLQDFWGRRWNIMVTSILRPTVYEPVRNLGSRFVGRKWASIPAVFGTFVVSGAMHELIFYYLGRMRPTWEISLFFLLHGACLMAEIAAKKALKDRWRLPRVVSTPLTVGFVMVTGFWLFFPQLLRCRADERAFEEYAAVGAFVKNVSSLTITSLHLPVSTLKQQTP